MTISVVTPSYNQGTFIERTLLSVLSQDYEPLEYVVMDGGSRDETVGILKAHDGRVRWVSEPDGGQAHAVNKGIRATSGELIGWLNSDDVYYPGTLRAVADYFAAHPEVEIVYGRADYIDIEDRPIGDYPTEPWDLKRLHDFCFICQPAVFFRRSLVERHGLLAQDLNFCMDYEFWLRLGRAGVRFGYLDRKLAGSRMYPQNKTLGSKPQVHAEINDMFKRRFHRVPDRWLLNFAHIQVVQRLAIDKYPRRYLVEVALRSFAASIRWNGTVSLGLMREVLMRPLQRRFFS